MNTKTWSVIGAALLLLLALFGVSAHNKVLGAQIASMQLQQKLLVAEKKELAMKVEYASIVNEKLNVRIASLEEFRRNFRGFWIPPKMEVGKSDYYAVISVVNTDVVVTPDRSKSLPPTMHTFLFDLTDHVFVAMELVKPDFGIPLQGYVVEIHGEETNSNSYIWHGGKPAVALMKAHGVTLALHQ